MTEKQRDRAALCDTLFDVLTKAGMTVFIIGFPVTLILGRSSPVGFCLVGAGAFLCILGFWIDMMFNPVWKRGR